MAPHVLASAMAAAGAGWICRRKRGDETAQGAKNMKNV